MPVIDFDSLKKQKSVVTDEQKRLITLLAEEALLVEVNPVSNKKHLPNGADKNDFVSLASYWWPNPDTEDGLPFVRRDGQVDPLGRDTDYFDRKRLDEMTAAVGILAVAWYYTDDRRFNDRACEHITAWFVNPETRMKPQLPFAQQIPGIRLGSEFGIIDTAAFVDMLDSVLLLDYDRVDELRSWVGDYLDWLLTSHEGHAADKKENNHALWYDAQVMAYAEFTGRLEVVEGRANSLKKRLTQQVAEDGSLPEELERTRSYMYSHFALKGIYSANQIASPYGWGFLEGYKRCFDFLMSFINGEKKWEYTQILDEDPPFAPLAMRFGYRFFGDEAFLKAAEKKYAATANNPYIQLRFPL